MRARLRDSRGFTLIEALVAFAILALALSQLLSGVSGGVRNESRADFLLRATRHGSSQLDALGANGKPPAGETRGRYDDGLVWSLVVEPGVTVRGPTGAAAAESYHARLVIRRDSGYGDSLTLSTVKFVILEERPQ